MEGVAEADVVVTTRALRGGHKYQRELETLRGGLQGLDARAQRIKAIALESGVTEVRNVPRRTRCTAWTSARRSPRRSTTPSPRS
jgi:hypothetical protein